MREIKLASKAGFCFGVDRAVQLAYDISNKSVKGCTLGPLIHNSFVTDDLASRGIRIIETPFESNNDETIIIRAHGITSDIYSTLDSLGRKYVDATCPFVKKIHSIVDNESKDNSTVLISGDSNHPEVIGIKSYCHNSVYVFNSFEELCSLYNENKSVFENNFTFVSQTTFSREEWKKCEQFIKNNCTKAKIFDTICNATRERQQEASELSKECDAMIVIGGKHSSNTVKLYNACKVNCDSFLVERALELKNIDLTTYAKIGVTAGASTPAEIIKEVLLAMSENMEIETVNTQVEEVPSSTAVDTDNFSALLAEELNDDSVIKCTVMGITLNEIQVDIPKDHVLGGLTGLVTYDEYSNDPTADPAKELKIGDEITLVIMKKNDADGTVMLSKKRFDGQKSWTDVIDAEKEGTILEGVVTDVINGGVLVNYKGSRIFIPASLATERKDEDLNALLKKTVSFKVIEVNQQRKRAVGSVRAVLKDAKKAASEAFWADAAEGKVYTGVVKSLTNYGAFVDIGGIDGMVHISELSWKRIKHPSDVLTVGQEIEVYIKALDAENKKISLGYRKDEDNPWAILKKSYDEGSVAEAEVVSLTSFGAFARIIPGIDGLIHISQITNHRINNPAEVLTVGEKVTCKITAIDYDKKRVSLSIRALMPEEEEEAVAEEVIEEATEE